MVCETWATKNSDATIAKFSQTTGLEVISIPRPPTPNEKSKTVGGGIAIIYRKHLRVELSAFAPEGAALLRVSQRTRSSFNLIVAYPPPTSSKYAENRKIVFEFIATQLRNSHPLPCIIAGDLNIRLYDMFGSRYTEDVGQLSPEGRNFAEILVENNQSSIAGRTPETRASFTSQSGAGTGAAESDYICSASLEDTPYTPPAPPLPLSQTRKKNEHKPIFASIKLQVITPIPLPPRAERLPKISIPPYCATDTWEELANSQLQSIPDLRTSISQPESTVQAKHDAIHQFLRQPVLEHLTGDPHPLSGDTLRKSFSGKLLPPDMLELRSQVAAALKQASKTGSKLKKATGEARTPLTVEYERHRDDHKRLKKLFTDRSDSFFRTLTSSTFPSAFKHSSSPIFKVLNDSSSTTTSTAPHRIPDRNGQPAHVWMGEEAAEELKEVAEPPGITTHPEFQEYIAKPPLPASNIRASDPITPLEVYQTLHGASKKHGFHRCSTNCIQCDYEEEWFQRWVAGGTKPRMPTLKTSVSFQQEDLPAEAIAFTRFPKEGGTTDDLRMDTATALATLYNQMLTTGVVPDGFADILMTPLLKPAKAGGSTNPLSSKGYRKISQIKLLHKVLSLILTRRLSHELTSGTPSHRSQGGFSFKQSTELQLMTLLDLLHERAASNLPPSDLGDSCILFIDICQAYDRISHLALWAKMKVRGLGDRFICLVKAIYAKCRARLKVNGTYTAFMRVLRGVLQGDPLSCALFLLFIDDLPAFVESKMAHLEVNNIRELLLQLLFADDYAAVARNSAIASQILAHVEVWCWAWGLEINFLIGKSHLVTRPRILRPLPKGAPPHQESLFPQTTALTTLERRWEHMGMHTLVDLTAPTWTRMPTSRMHGGSLGSTSTSSPDALGSVLNQPPYC